MIFGQIKHLLPKARAWRLTLNLKLWEFFEGVANGLEDLGVLPGPVEYFDGIFDDQFPATTTLLDEWEAEFGLWPSPGLTTQDRRDRLQAAWMTTGGQSPYYIQSILQASGFPVYAHDWWVPGTNNPRDPNSYITDPAKQVVNNLETLIPNVVAFGKGFSMGKTVTQFGGIDGTEYAKITYPVPSDPADWHYYVYIGGETFGDTADVPEARRIEFESLILKLIPKQLWVGLIINYT